MSQNNAAAKTTAPTTNEQTAAPAAAAAKPGLTAEQMQFIANNPELVQKVVDKAVRTHQIKTAAKYIGIGGAAALIAYGIFRVTRG